MTGGDCAPPSKQHRTHALCEALARVAKRLCITHISPEIIAPILACRLIALDKCPGVRPIGIGDMARRIMAKAVLRIVRGDVQEATGTKQLCAGQIAGVETAIHSVHDSFELDETEAVLLIDASNAFNSLNRKVALHNAAPNYLPFYKTHMVPAVTYSLMGKLSNRKRAPPKVTLLRCQCTHWQQYP